MTGGRVSCDKAHITRRKSTHDSLNFFIKDSTDSKVISGDSSTFSFFNVSLDYGFNVFLIEHSECIPQFVSDNLFHSEGYIRHPSIDLLFFVKNEGCVN